MGELKARKLCACGLCERCLNRARWDRIYKEKFEDPDYYGRRYRGPQSTLGRALASGRGFGGETPPPILRSETAADVVPIPTKAWKRGPYLRRRWTRPA